MLQSLYFQEYLQDYRRRVNSLNLNIDIEQLTVFRLSELCLTIKSGDKRYNLEIILSSQTTPIRDISCTCPDFSFRGNTCKHIYWFGQTQLGALYPNTWSESLIEKFVAKKLKCDHSSIRNEICPICQEQFNLAKRSEGDEIIICKYCENAVHSLCWVRYFYNSYQDRCVLCRHKTMPGTAIVF